MNLLQSHVDQAVTFRIGDDGALIVEFSDHVMPILLKATDTLLVHREGPTIIFEVRTTPVT